MVTFREMLMKEHPERVTETAQGGCWGCPCDYGYEKARHEYCGADGDVCRACWDREAPPTAAQLRPIAVPVQPEPTLEPVQPEQRHFETGAVRDDATGKGRYDLLPWGAIHALAQHSQRGAAHYGERNVDKGIPQHSLIDSALRHIGQYIQGDPEDHHLVAAFWNIAWALEQELKRPELIDLPERGEHSGVAW